MTKENIYSKRCVELVSGNEISGNIEISKNNILLKLISNRNSFKINERDPVFIETEDNKIISLYDNISGGSGFNKNNINGKTSYFQDIISNISIKGNMKWDKNDKIKRTIFRLKKSDTIFIDYSKLDNLSIDGNYEDNKYDIFSLNLNNINIKSYYFCNYGHYFNTPTDFWPVFEIEFINPLNIYDYYFYVWSFSSFVSMCFGQNFVASSILIDSLSSFEAKKEKYNNQFEVNYINEEILIRDRDIWAGYSPIGLWNDQMHDEFKNCLAIWMNRCHEWKNSYSLMMKAFSMRNEINSERIVNAYKWFEELPNAKPMSVIKKSDIKAIYEAAINKSVEIGLDTSILKDRIITSISNISKERSDDQFKRLVKIIENKFGKNALRNSVIIDLNNARKFRGIAAHKNLITNSDLEFNNLCKAIDSIESICYLLTIIDFPISDEGINRVISNPILRDYRNNLDT